MSRLIDGNDIPALKYEDQGDRPTSLAQDSPEPPATNSTTPSTPDAMTPPAAVKTPRGKRWSEMKEWKKVIDAAQGKQQCPDDVYDIVDTCLVIQGQTKLKSRYMETLAEAVKNGWQSMVAAKEEQGIELEKAYRDLDKEQQKVAKLKAELKKVTQKTSKTSALAAKKSALKGKDKEKTPSTATFQLPLPPIPELRMTTQAPNSVKPYVQHSEMLLDQGAALLRSTEAHDWTDRALNWLTTVETRPEIKYK